MKIITGKYKGRVIQMPKGIRPTQDKVRKALFDILGDIKGLSFLELFAGSGAIGIEALSQGAKEVLFVEKDRSCIEKIKQNLSLLGFSDFWVLGLDTLEAIRKLSKAGEKFDIIFLDPPYHKRKLPRLCSGLAEIGMGDSLVKKTLQTLGAYDILAPNAFIIAQHFKKDNLPDRLADLALFKQASYGDTLLSFYKKLQQ